MILKIGYESNIDSRPQKIPMIKALREVNGLGLRDAKDVIDRVVDGIPYVFKVAGDGSAERKKLRDVGLLCDFEEDPICSSFTRSFISSRRRRKMPFDIISSLNLLGGYWKYHGGRYLAKLTSGQVSDTYVNCSPLMARPGGLKGAVAALLERLGGRLGEHLSEEEMRKFGPTNYARYSLMSKTTVCGPAVGAIPLAFEMARQIGGHAIFTEPVYKERRVCDPDDILKTEVVKAGQQLKRFDIGTDQQVLFVEDVITTGKSSYQMMEAVWKARGMVIGTLPYILCLVNRSGLSHLDGPRGCDEIKIISLADIQARTWDTVLDAVADLEQEYIPPENVSRGEWLEAVRPKDDWDKLSEEP